jgi:hypothetical protein
MGTTLDPVECVTQHAENTYQCLGSSPRHVASFVTPANNCKPSIKSDLKQVFSFGVPTRGHLKHPHSAP